jgi:hypothetical protein
MAYPILCFQGPSSVGKDTAAAFVLNTYDNVVVTSFADPIKYLILNVFWNVENRTTNSLGARALWGASNLREQPANRFLAKKRPDFAEVELQREWSGGLSEAFLGEVWDSISETTSVRDLLISVGEGGREVDPDIWVDMTTTLARSLLCSGEADLVVVPDGRRNNEVLRMKEIGGVVVGLRDPDTTPRGRPDKEALAVPKFWFDRIIENRKTGNEPLEESIRTIITQHFGYLPLRKG